MTQVTVISDLHYYSPRLGTVGKAYTLRSQTDQRVLAESPAVIQSALSRIANSDTDALLICGDLTNNGERVCHEEFLTLLQSFVQKKPAFVITSTHDWCSNGFSHRYEGDTVFTDVPVFSREELADYYNEIGKNAELARFKTLSGFYSKVYRISPELRLLAVNDDGDGKNGASGYSNEHLQWMCKQIKEAQKDGCSVIAMEHHLLIPCIHPMLNSSQMIANAFETADILADAGLRLMLVGHSHMQRTACYTSKNGNKITQINVGALTGYPNPVVKLTVNENKARIHVESAVPTEYNGTLLDEEFFKQHTAGVLLSVIQSACQSKALLSERLKAQGIPVSSLSLIYPLLKPLCKHLSALTVGRAGRFINILTLGKAIPEKELSAIQNEPLLSYILQIFFSVFDGSKAMPFMSYQAKTVAVRVGELPLKAAKRLPFPQKTKQKLLTISENIVEIFYKLLYENPDMNLDCEIDLC